jgi:hypothetical protein
MSDPTTGPTHGSGGKIMAAAAGVQRLTGTTMGRIAIMGGTIVCVFFIGLSVRALIGGGGAAVRPAEIGPVSSLSDNPGAIRAPDVVRNAQRDVNRQDYQDSVRNGQSNIPIPLGDVHPLIPIEQPQTRPTADAATPAPPPDTKRSERMAQKRRKVEEQVGKILDRRLHQPMDGWDQDLEEDVATGGVAPGKVAAGNDAGRNGAAGVGDAGYDAVKAGDTAWARVKMTATTDAPTEIVAEVVEGRLKGAVLIGPFKAGQDAIALTFTRMSWSPENLRDVPVEAIALDPEKSSPALASKVEPHLWERVILPAVSGALGFLGEVASRGGTTISVSPTSAVSQTVPLTARDQILVAAGGAAKAYGQVLQQDNAGKKATVSYEAGLPVVVMFLKSVRGRS